MMPKKVLVSIAERWSTLFAEQILMREWWLKKKELLNPICQRWSMTSEALEKLPQLAVR